VLVNCAGGIPAGASELDILDLNLRAALRTTELSSARVVIHIASVAGIDDGPHPSPAYAAAKAGLVRFTTAYAGPVRMNCIVPGWIATARGLREREQMTPEERDAAGPMVSMDAIADAMMALLREEAARSRVVVIR
jgi:NAD(P)-dependent dehydrogenase (short-subunit alcohol dehydrogenase family)